MLIFFWTHDDTEFTHCKYVKRYNKYIMKKYKACSSFFLCKRSLWVNNMCSHKDWNHQGRACFCVFFFFILLLPTDVLLHSRAYGKLKVTKKREKERKRIEAITTLSCRNCSSIHFYFHCLATLCVCVCVCCSYSTLSLCSDVTIKCFLLYIGFKWFNCTIKRKYW